MNIIADSGGTKTAWVITDGQTVVKRIETSGINPRITPGETIDRTVAKELLPEVDPGVINSIFYYGAGCSSESTRKIIHTILQDHFPASAISVDHDLLAAARAACGKEEGIAIILGTGSNACYYDGEYIADQIISLGYLLGDEGSGNQMGKKLLRGILHKEAPAELIEHFHAEIALSTDEIMHKLYKEPAPNTFLAGFSRFILKYIDHPYMKKLAEDCFSDFFEKQVLQYSGHETRVINGVGSVAYYFQEQFKSVATSYGYRTGSIYKDPMEGLIKYHL